MAKDESILANISQSRRKTQQVSDNHETCTDVLTDRLPTVSATDILKDTATGASQNILLGLNKVDSVLRGIFDQQDPGTVSSGFARGDVVEILGPPGAGKTTFCMQACSRSLLAGDSVVWVDTASQISGIRLQQILSCCQSSEHGDVKEKELNDALGRFSHFYAPTLAHLIALLSTRGMMHQSCPTSILVLDSISSPVDLAYPRGMDHRYTTRNNDGQKSIRSPNRRQAIIEHLGSSLARLAALENVAVLVTNEVMTKIRGQAQAMLEPSVSGYEWDDAVSTRITLYHDWAHSPDKAEAKQYQSARFIGVNKARGTSLCANSSLGNVTAFGIVDGGIVELINITMRNTFSQSIERLSDSRRKRPFSDMASSEAEDSDREYGWADDADHIAAEGLVDESCLVGNDMSGTLSTGEHEQRPESAALVETE